MNNICQGSIGVGFVLPLLPCSMMSQLANNVAGSCSIGFILNKVEGDCMSFSGVRAYACGIGQIVNPPNTLSLSLSNFILADNGRAATLRFGL